MPAQIPRVAVQKKQVRLGEPRVQGQSHKEALSPVCPPQSGDRSSPDVVLGGAKQRLDDYLTEILWRRAKQTSDQLTSEGPMILKVLWTTGSSFFSSEAESFNISGLVSDDICHNLHTVIWAFCLKCAHHPNMP